MIFFTVSAVALVINLSSIAERVCAGKGVYKGGRGGATNSSVTRYFLLFFECNKPQWTIAYFDPKWLIINCHFNYTMARVVACPEVWGGGGCDRLSNPFCEGGGRRKGIAFTCYLIFSRVCFGTFAKQRSEWGNPLLLPLGQLTCNSLWQHFY